MGFLTKLKILLCCCFCKDPNKTTDETYTDIEGQMDETILPATTPPDFPTDHDENLTKAAVKMGVTSFFIASRNPKFYNPTHHQGTVVMYKFIKKIKEKHTSIFVRNICSKLRMVYYIKGEIEKKMFSKKVSTEFKFNLPKCVTESQIIKYPQKTLEFWKILSKLMEEYRPKFCSCVSADEILKENLLPAGAPDNVEKDQLEANKVVIKELVNYLVVDAVPKSDFDIDESSCDSTSTRSSCDSALSCVSNSTQSSYESTNCTSRGSTSTFEDEEIKIPKPRGRKSRRRNFVPMVVEEEDILSDYELQREKTIHDNLEMLKSIFSKIGINLNKDEEPAKLGKRKKYLRSSLPPPRAKSLRLQTKGNGFILNDSPPCLHRHSCHGVQCSV